MVATRPKRAPAIKGVEISVFAHATEDEERVRQAVMNLIPEGVDAVGAEVQRLRGHHNDPILLMTMRIKRRRAAGELFRNLIRGLSTPDRLRLLDEVEDRVDEAGSLYLRLDKQEAYRGRAALHDVDPIRMKFRFRVPHKADPVTFVRSHVSNIIDEIENGPGDRDFAGG